jgi:RimJ/RimL family protein N-acetyltransferase
VIVTAEKVTTWPQAEELRRLRNECREYMTGDTTEISTGQQVKFYEERILAGTVRAVLLRCDGRAVAYGLLRPGNGAPGWMSCGVTARMRGRGLGTAVVRAVTAMASDTGRPVRLEVWQDNAAARRVYEKAGYAVTGSGIRDGRVFELMEHP